MVLQGKSIHSGISWCSLSLCTPSGRLLPRKGDPRRARLPPGRRSETPVRFRFSPASFGIERKRHIAFAKGDIWTMLLSEKDSGTYGRAKLDYRATVRELPSHERPRERLQHFGPQALSTAELLAIILRTGTRGDNVLDLANRLLAKYGGLSGLVRADFRELCAEHGMGEAKSAQVKAALEIGRRLSLLQTETRYKIRTPADAANLVMLDMAYLDTEQMRILLLDSKGQLVEQANLYRGTVNSAVMRAAEIFRPAIIRNCPGIILCHNHPSGDPEPSPDDIETTQRLVEAGRLLDIELVDHIIIGHQRFVSLKKHLGWE